MTYRDAGVDIDAADRLVEKIARLAAATRRPEVLSGVGLFAAAVRIPKGYREPVLMTATDGVGTKLALARLAGRHDTIGIDLVAMNANDILTSGAKPLCFLDYLSMGNLGTIDAEAILRGIAEGCKRAAASLVGGETAEMPGFYRDGEYDLAGFCIGIVERREILTGSKIRPGNVIIGLSSSGLHSNGYSLARRALGVETIRGLDSLARRHPTLGSDPTGVLLEPTEIYTKPVLAALKRFSINGMAHITGGGIPGNLVRVLPKKASAVIYRNSLPRQEIFETIRRAGRIERAEMDRTFNCGVGYCLVVARKDVDALCAFLRRRRVGASVIGEIRSGRRGVRYRESS